MLRDPTIDLDASDIEVYGKTKQGVGWNYTGVRSGRVHLASWAQAELPLAADLIAGNTYVRPDAGGLLAQALASMPTQVCGRPRVRADAGYFDATLAHAAVELGCDFAIAAKRNPAAWRSLSAVPDGDWREARGMHGAQVAGMTTPPRAGPTGPTRSSAGSRSALTSSVPTPARDAAGPSRKTSSRWARGGAADYVWAVSFIVTNIPANHGDLVGLEAWFRNRTAIEERFREVKHGGGLNHLPSADPAVNSVWMWT